MLFRSSLETEKVQLLTKHLPTRRTDGCGTTVQATVHNRSSSSLTTLCNLHSEKNTSKVQINFVAWNHLNPTFSAGTTTTPATDGPSSCYGGIGVLIMEMYLLKMRETSQGVRKKTNEMITNPTYFQRNEVSVIGAASTNFFPRLHSAKRS